MSVRKFGPGRPPPKRPVATAGECVRCEGNGLDPNGPGEGYHGTEYCRRCAGAGTQEAGPSKHVEKAKELASRATGYRTEDYSPADWYSRANYHLLLAIVEKLNPEVTS